MNVGSATGYLDIDIRDFLTGLKTAQSEASKTTGNILEQTGSKLQGFGSKLSGIGSTLTKTLTVPLAGIAGLGLKVAIDFEEGMSKVRAVTGATGDEFDKLRGKALELGESTSFSANDVALAMSEMAKAGWEVTDIYDGMGAVLDAASASGEDLALVSTVMADTMSAFGLEGIEASRVADLLTYAANAGTISISDLGESFKQAAPVAKAAGWELEDVTTAITAMSFSGIKGSAAGTALKGVFDRLIDPSKKAKDIMNQYGISVSDAEGNIKPLNTILGDLRKSFSTTSTEITKADGTLKDYDEIMRDVEEGTVNATDAQKLFALSAMFGKEALPGLLSILNMTQEEYDALEESTRNAGGTARETAEIMKDNVAGQIEGVKGQLETLAITLAQQLMPHISNFLTKISELVEWFSNLDEGTQQTILKFAGLAMIAGPVTSGVGSITTGVGHLISGVGKIPGGILSAKTSIANFGEGVKLAQAGFPGLAKEASGLGAKLGSLLVPKAVSSGTAIAGMGGAASGAGAGMGGLAASLAGLLAPIAAIVAAIAAVTGAIVYLWKTNEGFRDSITAVWEGIKGAFADAGQSVVDTLNRAGFDFENFGEVVKAVGEGIKEAFRILMDFVAPIFIFLAERIGSTIEFIVGHFAGLFKVIMGIITFDGEMIKEGFGDIWRNIKEFAESTWNSIKKFFEGILDAIAQNFFGVTWGELWEGILGKVQGAWDSFIGFFRNLPENIGNIVRDIINWFKELPGKIWDAITSVPEKIGGWVGDIGSKAGEIKDGFIEKVKGFFEGLPGDIGGFLLDTGSKVVEFVGGLPEKASGIKTGFIDPAVESFRGFAENIWTHLKGAGEKVVDFVQGVGEKSDEVKTGFIDKVQEYFGELPEGIGGFLTTTLTNVATWTGEMLGKAKETGSGFLSEIKTNISQVPTNVKTFVDDTKGKVDTWSSGMISKAKETGTEFLKGINDKVKDVPTRVNEYVTTTKNNVFTWGGEMVNKAQETGTNFLSNITTKFDQLPGKVSEKTGDTWSNISTWASNIINKGEEGGSGFLNNVTTFISELPGKVWDFLSNCIDKLMTWVHDMGNKGREAVNNLINNVVSAGAGIAGQAMSIGSNIVSGVWAGFSGAIGGFRAQVQSAFSGVVNSVKSSLGIRSPSTVFQNVIGRWLPPGVAVGFEKAMPSATKTMLKSLMGGIEDIEDEAEKAEIDIQPEPLEFNLFADGLEDIYKNVENFFKSAETSIHDSVNRMIEDIQRLLEMSEKLAFSGGDFDYINYDVNFNKKKETTREEYRGQPEGNDGNGDIFNFYSPKIIDEVEASKQLRRVKRDIAEGFLI